MRAFVAISIPEEIKNRISEIQNQIPKFNGKLTEKENLHLTLKFLGEISQDLLENVKSALSRIKFPTLSLLINKLGTFNYQNNPRIVWLHINGADELQRKVDSALSEFFRPEERFMSHLTIARVKYVDNTKKFSEEIEKIKFPNLSFEPGSFELIESCLTKQGSVYKLIETYRTERLNK